MEAFAAGLATVLILGTGALAWWIWQVSRDTSKLNDETVQLWNSIGRESQTQETLKAEVRFEVAEGGERLKHLEDIVKFHAEWIDDGQKDYDERLEALGTLTASLVDESSTARDDLDELSSEATRRLTQQADALALDNQRVSTLENRLNLIMVSLEAFRIKSERTDDALKHLGETVDLLDTATANGLERVDDNSDDNTERLMVLESKLNVLMMGLEASRVWSIKVAARLDTIDPPLTSISD